MEILVLWNYQYFLPMYQLETRLNSTIFGQVCNSRHAQVWSVNQEETQNSKQRNRRKLTQCFWINGIGRGMRYVLKRTLTEPIAQRQHPGLWQRNQLCPNFMSVLASHYVERNDPVNLNVLIYSWSTETTKFHKLRTSHKARTKSIAKGSLEVEPSGADQFCLVTTWKPFNTRPLWVSF